MTYSIELGPIRPPSEAYSLLIRATRNCPWNRCKFCHNYKGTKFQLRPLQEIKQDIQTVRVIRDKIMETSWKSGLGGDARGVAGILNDSLNGALRHVALWLLKGGNTVFLQDANSLIMKTDDLAEVIRLLKETFPDINRVASYARSKTAAKKKSDELVELYQAGLSRLHIGLETGYDPLLQYMDKGNTAAEHIAGGRKIVESGISLSEYVILGLGGKEMWREHAVNTAAVLNEIAPAFIRVRTLAVNNRMPLYSEVENDSFIRASDEEIINEERLFMENLECPSHYVSDHITNLLQETEGELPRDKERMLASIDRFLALSPEEKTNFKVGRRAGIYYSLDDLYDSRRRQATEQVIFKLSHGNNKIEEKTLYALMEGFI
ncbi:radical SAM protein [Chloroflexota bacterium]